jgi:hypothetical protein
MENSDESGCLEIFRKHFLTSELLNLNGKQLSWTMYSHNCYINLFNTTSVDQTDKENNRFMWVLDINIEGNFVLESVIATKRKALRKKTGDIRKIINYLAKEVTEIVTLK